MLRVFKVFLALTPLASAPRHLHSLGIAHGDLKPQKRGSDLRPPIASRHGQLGRVRYGLLWTQVLESRPFAPPEALVRDAATGRVRVRAFRLDRATGGRADVASGVGP